MTHNVAITGVGAVVGLGVVKSIRLSKKLGPIKITGLDINPESVGFFLCDSSHVIPRISSPGYIDAVLDICKQDGVDAFLPLIEDEFMQVLDNMHRFNDAGVSVIIHPRETIRIFRDKAETAVKLKEAGIRTPDTEIFSQENRDGVMRLLERHGFPLFAKPRHGRSSKGLILIRSMKQMEAYLDLLKDERYIIQEYLGGDDQEFTCTIFKTPDMEDPYIIALKRELSNGTTVSAEVVEDEGLIDVCNKLAHSFSIEGSLNIQIRKKGGLPYVFEVNPRYSSTAFIRAMCGYNDAEMGIDYFLNKKIDPVPAIKKCKIVRYWEELCVRCD